MASVAPVLGQRLRRLNRISARANQPLQQLVDKAVSPRRFVALLLGGFAAFRCCLRPWASTR